MKSKSRSAKEICCEIEALCETACEPESQQALDKYHKGSVHATILISTGFSDRIQTEIRRIRSGKPSPYPFFICCEGCFASSSPNPLSIPIRHSAATTNRTIRFGRLSIRRARPRIRSVSRGFS